MQLIKRDEPYTINHRLTKKIICFLDYCGTVMAHHERMNGRRRMVLFASDNDLKTLHRDGQFVLHDVPPVVFNLFGARFGRFRFLCKTPSIIVSPKKSFIFLTIAGL